MMSVVSFVQSHLSVVLGVMLALSEAMALVFPNASGILKAISLLKSAGAKDASGN